MVEKVGVQTRPDGWSTHNTHIHTLVHISEIDAVCGDRLTQFRKPEAGALRAINRSAVHTCIISASCLVPLLSRKRRKRKFQNNIIRSNQIAADRRKEGLSARKQRGVWGERTGISGVRRCRKQVVNQDFS